MTEPTHSLDLDRLPRLRVTVARFGEMDSSRWWNTKGQLGRFRRVHIDAAIQGQTKSRREAGGQHE